MRSYKFGVDIYINVDDEATSCDAFELLAEELDYTCRQDNSLKTVVYLDQGILIEDIKLETPW